MGKEFEKSLSMVYPVAVFILGMISLMAANQVGEQGHPVCHLSESVQIPRFICSDVINTSGASQK